MSSSSSTSSSQYLPYLASISIFLIFPLLAKAHSCSEGFSIEAGKRNIRQNCQLKTLGAELAWNFDNKSGQLDIAFGARLESPTGWLAWGLNPEGPSMVGTRALIGIKLSSDWLRSNTYNITAATKRHCLLSPAADIGLDVRNFSFVRSREIGYYVILATLFLSKEYNSSSTNVVWQIGRFAADGGPGMHSTSLDNLDCYETVNLVSGEVLSFKPHERQGLRTAHGILNMVGWGIFLPVGVMGARYFRVFPRRWPWWFVFHVSFQIAGYALGTMGWIIGLWLGYKSKYYRFPTHRIIAIIIFTFTTIQMMALRLKPKFSDEYRAYWNMYHHFLGYALLALIWLNIFEGIMILETVGHLSWRMSYFGVLGALGAAALALEIFTWIEFFKKALQTNVGKHPSDGPNSSQISAVQPQLPEISSGI